MRAGSTTISTIHAPHCAAEAAVAEHGDGVSAALQRLSARHQLAVNVNLTKLVLDDSNALAVLA
jgi:hypothetical protein